MHPHALPPLSRPAGDRPPRSLKEMAAKLVDSLVANGVLAAGVRERAVQTLSSREHMKEARGSRQLERPGGDKERGRGGGGGDKGLEGAGDSLANVRGGSNPDKPPLQSDTQTHSQPPSSKRAPLDLSPDGDEEAFELLVAHVDYVDEQVMAFVRLSRPIQTGVEKATPARFVFLLLTPSFYRPREIDEAAATDPVQIATAFAALMLDEDFVGAVQSCHSVPTFHDLLARELDCVTIVPSSHMPVSPRLATAHSATARAATMSAAARGPKATRTRVSVIARRHPSLHHRSRTLTHLWHGRSQQMEQAEKREGAADANSGAGRIWSPACGLPPQPPSQQQAGRLARMEGGGGGGGEMSAAAASHAPALASDAANGGSEMMLGGQKVKKKSVVMEAPSSPSNSRPRSPSSPVRRKPPPQQWSLRRVGRKFVHACQAYSLPLLLGIAVALVWANTHPVSYDAVMKTNWGFTAFASFIEHDLSVKFLVNDIFMAFFFGLATKEVTEACLPGGSLNPPRKALAPLIGCIAGVLGPIAVYHIVLHLQYSLGAFDGYESLEAFNARAYLDSLDSSGSSSGSGGSGSGGGRLLASSSGSGAIDPADALRWSNFSFTSPEASLSFEELVNGWGVPTATDISLAWMVAVQVFPLRHPAIEFLLLLAVADDAIGLVIIAVKYPSDPTMGARPEWLLLTLGGMLAALTLRLVFRARHWTAYILIGGLPSWVGFIKARLHPALALAVIVPMMPASNIPRTPLLSLFKSCNPFARKRQPASARGAGAGSADDDDPSSHGAEAVGGGLTVEGPDDDYAIHEHDLSAPLHAFEHHMKLAIDFGMFFFTLANAGVKMDNIGPLTVTIATSLIVGKVIFITLIVIVASRCGCAPVPSAMAAADVTMVSGMAAIGLTVALFISDLAFRHDRLKAEAKMGALLSGLMGFVCVGLSRTPLWPAKRRSKPIRAQVGPGGAGGSPTSPAMPEDDVGDVAYMVYAQLESTYQMSRALRKDILAGRTDAFSPLNSGRGYTPGRGTPIPRRLTRASTSQGLGNWSSATPSFPRRKSRCGDPNGGNSGQNTPGSPYSPGLMPTSGSKSPCGAMSLGSSMEPSPGWSSAQKSSPGSGSGGYGKSNSFKL